MPPKDVTRGPDAPGRAVPAAPACRGEPALEVLPTSDQQPLDIDLLQPPQAGLAHPLPLLRFPEERLGPQPALAHRLLISLGVMIGSVALQIFRPEWPVHHSAVVCG